MKRKYGEEFKEYIISCYDKYEVYEYDDIIQITLSMDDYHKKFLNSLKEKI